MQSVLRYLPFALVVASTGFMTSVQAEGVAQGPGAACREIVDRVARLDCFDAAYETPVPEPLPEPPSTSARETGPIRTLAGQMESSRAPGEAGWIVRVRPWHEDVLLAAADFDGRVAEGLDPVSADVFMTMREAGAAAGTPSDKPLAEQAVLLLSCENDITTLGVLLPKPINTLQANLSLSGDRGSVFRLNWRDTENGDVIIAGRGLESIDTIQTIAGYGRVLLQVSYPEGARAFVFDIADLRERLKPLRTACHW